MNVCCGFYLRNLSQYFSHVVELFLVLVTINSSGVIASGLRFLLADREFKQFYGRFRVKLSLFEGYSVGFMDYYYTQLYSLQRRKC